MCDNNMDEMIEREWACADCRVAKYSWGFRVWACGGHCDVVPGNGDDMDACEAALDNGESPIASGWEDGAGHDVAAECERTSDDGEEAEYVLYARVDVYADLGTGEGHNVGEGVTGLHPHEGEPVDVFMLEYRCRFPEGRSLEYGPWDALAGCGRITPEDGDVEGWEQVYDLLDDLHVETSWEEGPVCGALSDPKAIADRIRAGLKQGRE